jgi:Holliday junction resolvase RusA-like endonuclease
MTDTYLVLGIPKAQGRVRFARIGKFVKTYDPAASREHKENLRAQIAGQNPKMHDVGALILRVEFHLPRPKAHYDSKGRIKLACLNPRPTKKPDLDNMVKAVKDACNGLCWHDDAQVVGLHATKWYGTEPHTSIEIEEV